MNRLLFFFFTFFALLLAGCAPSNVRISQGTFNDGYYTSNVANFKCFIGAERLEGGSSYKLIDTQQNANGSMQLINDFGFVQSVEYLPISNLLPELKTLIEDPATYSKGLETIQDYLLQALVSTSPNTQLLHSEYLPSERIRVAVFYVPQGSFLLNQNDNVNLDAVQAYYLFANNTHLYYVKALTSIWPGLAQPAKEGIIQNLDDFYKSCTFGS